MKQNIDKKDIILQLISDFWDGIQKPVCINIGFLELVLNKHANYSTVYITNILRANGVDAVPFFDPCASEPSKTIVTATGIQTPFVSPKNAKKTALALLDILEENGVCCNIPFPTTIEQLQEPGNTKIDTSSHEIKTLIRDLLSTARKDTSLLTLSDLDRQNKKSGYQSIFRGGMLGGNPYAVIAEKETHSVAYASEHITVADLYSFGGGKTNRNLFTKGKAYGFIYEYETAPYQKFYDDFHLEHDFSFKLHTHQNKPLDLPPDIAYETPVFPHKNPIKNIYLKINDQQFFKMPMQDQNWNTFLAAHIIKDNCIFGHIATRRLCQLSEKTILGEVCTHALFNSDSLSSRDFSDQSHIQSIDFYKGIWGDNAVIQLKNGTIAWTNQKIGHPDQPLTWYGDKLSFLGLTKFPQGQCDIDFDYCLENNTPSPTIINTKNQSGTESSEIKEELNKINILCKEIFNKIQDKKAEKEASLLQQLNTPKAQNAPKASAPGKPIIIVKNSQRIKDQKICTQKCESEKKEYSR